LRLISNRWKCGTVEEMRQVDILSNTHFILFF
jgi:hypothetical protein